jgi:lactoylglutathione lyase
MPSGRGPGSDEMKATFSYTGIRVKDLEESVAFYTRVLGMKEVDWSRIEGTKGRTASLVSEPGGPVLELNFYETGSPHATAYVEGSEMDHLAFHVDDLDAALAEARKLGYPTVLDIRSEKSRWAYIRDPNGIFIELFSG